MGESTFTKPLINWLENRRAKKEAQRQAAEEEQLAALVGGPVQSEASREMASDDRGEAVPEPAGVQSEIALDQAEPSTSDGTPPQVKELGYDLAQNVFGRSSNVAEEVRVEEPEPAEPLPRPQMTRVSIQDDGEESTDEDGTAEPQINVVMQDAQRRPRVPEAPPAPASESPTRPRPGSGEVLDSMPVSLKDVFKSNVRTNARVKALLKRHESVNGRELADELRDFAESLGDDGNDE